MTLRPEEAVAIRVRGLMLPADNRHTRLTKGLKDGIPPAQVTEWAGNSVPVLPATYARCVEGRLPDLKRRLEAAGDLPEPPGAG
ncbi:hypothetical protein QFZ66_005578 [Streptomyces sp. B4I13]|uniref:hypothetical protein n=1 Tax=Streptomyces sp. B4I13 TaxID=3042271 RepID=UPI002781E6E1|nr:hypothetical protein [Streptomyces sp. B4I13]MDQ0961700.1 hypothetical protein [Streptomyces sp. B4I13]